MYFSLLESSKAIQKLKNQFLEKIARHSLCTEGVSRWCFPSTPQALEGCRERICGNTKMKGQIGRRLWYLSSLKAHV